MQGTSAGAAAVQLWQRESHWVGKQLAQAPLRVAVWLHSFAAESGTKAVGRSDHKGSAVTSRAEQK